jgi:hypothetical protein
MKNLILFTLILILSNGLLAQQYSQPNRIFKKNQMDIQAGIGLLPMARILDGATIKMMPVSIEVNRMLGDHFSLGLFHGRSVAESRPIVIPDGVSQRVTNHTSQTALKAAFHVTRIDNADFYGGFMLAVNDSKFSVDKGDLDFLKTHHGIVPRKTKLTYTGFVGSRYAISSKWNLFGELGFGESILTVGFGYRLR